MMRRFGAVSAGGGGGGHRYWRIYITAVDGSTNYVGFTEIELRGSIGGPNLLSVQAQDGAANASDAVNASNAAFRAADRSMVSGWLHSLSLPSWWRYDFGGSTHSGDATADVKQVVIYGSWNVPTASPKDFQLQWSDDAISWSTALAVSNQTGWTGASDARAFNVP